MYSNILRKANFSIVKSKCDFSEKQTSHFIEKRWKGKNMKTTAQPLKLKIITILSIIYTNRKLMFLI